jgi:hypothetical protein
LSCPRSSGTESLLEEQNPGTDAPLLFSFGPPLPDAFALSPVYSPCEIVSHDHSQQQLLDFVAGAGVPEPQTTVADHGNLAHMGGPSPDRCTIGVRSGSVASDDDSWILSPTLWLSPLPSPPFSEPPLPLTPPAAGMNPCLSLGCSAASRVDGKARRRLAIDAVPTPLEPMKPEEVPVELSSRCSCHCCGNGRERHVSCVQCPHTFCQK